MGNLKMEQILGTAGMMVGPRDVQIAGLVISRGWTLVSGNKGEFSKVAGLKLEDWTQPA